jgi:hypothetical protein
VIGDCAIAIVAAAAIAFVRQAARVDLRDMQLHLVSLDRIIRVYVIKLYRERSRVCLRACGVPSRFEKSGVHACNAHFASLAYRLTTFTRETTVFFTDTRNDSVQQYSPILSRVLNTTRLSKSCDARGLSRTNLLSRSRSFYAIPLTVSRATRLRGASTKQRHVVM